MEFFFKMTTGSFIILFTLILFTWFINSCQLVAYTKSINLKLGLWENFLLSIKANLLNYIPLKPGLIIRSIELKKKNKLPHRDFIAFIVVRLAYSFVNQTIFFFIIIIFLFKKYFFSIYLIIFLILIFILIKTSLFLNNIKTQKIYLQSILNWFDKSFFSTLYNLKFYFFILIINLIQLFLLFTRFYIASKLLDYDLDKYQILIFIPFVIVSNYLNIVPGNLLIREAIVGLVAYFIGINFNLGFEVAMIDRLMILVVTSFSLVIYTISNLINFSSKN